MELVYNYILTNQVINYKETAQQDIQEWNFKNISNWKA